MSNIHTVKSPSGSILFVVPDGKGGINFLQQNGKPYEGECENLEYFCCNTFDKTLLGLELEGSTLSISYDNMEVDSQELNFISLPPEILISDGSFNGNGFGYGYGFTSTVDLTPYVTSSVDCLPIEYSVLNEDGMTVNFISLDNVEFVGDTVGTGSFQLQGTCADGITSDLGTFTFEFVGV